MTLEIQEIGIRMRVAEDGGKSPGTSGSGAAGAGCGEDSRERARRDAMVEDCVRRVLDVLKMREER